MLSMWYTCRHVIYYNVDCMHIQHNDSIRYDMHGMHYTYKDYNSTAFLQSCILLLYQKLMMHFAFFCDALIDTIIDEAITKRQLFSKIYAIGCMEWKVKLCTSGHTNLVFCFSDFFFFYITVPGMHS